MDTEKKSKLSPAKRALLEQRLRGVSGSAQTKRDIPRRPQQDSAPLSFAQQSLWFLDQLQPGSASYNVSRHVLISGSFNHAALEQALATLIERHESLRTIFRTEDSEPVQIIQPPLPVSLPVTDLSHLPADERAMETERLAVEHATAPFNLSAGPLFSPKLIRQNENQQLLLLAIHHIVTDAWSTSILVRELIALYEAFKRGEPSPLENLPLQYADFAVWQREQLTGDVLEKHLSFWKQQLAGAPALLELPAERSRPAIQTSRGAFETSNIPKEISEALRELANQEGATLFMTLLAAFDTLLYRYTGEDDLVIGSPIAGRSRAELENLVGFFVNSLPLRTILAGNPTFRDAIQRVKATVLEGFAHQDLPFEKIVEAVQPPRSLSYSPIFQVMFALENYSATADLSEIDPLKREYDSSKFDLTLFVTESAGGLGCWLEYNTDLFSESFARNALEHFQILLRGVVANPNERIANLPLIGEAETKQLLVDWNNTQTAFSYGGSIHGLFEIQAAQTPDSMALICGGDHLSYRELNERANQLARYLVRMGVGPETRVAICLSRNVELVVAVLAVLKAGGAYVPLDPAYPGERLAFTLEDSNALVLITDESLLKELPATQARRILVDADDDKIRREESANLPATCAPENLAYVIYTSGSTGRPKGVAIEHRSAVDFLNWSHTVFTREQLAAVLFSTSICFDLSVFELFAPLTAGGKVVLVANALKLTEIDSIDVTLVNTVPSALNELILMNGIPSSVKTINLAGEPLPGSLVDEIHRSTAVQKVFNLYGPSEDTTYSTYATALKDSSAEPTIGGPIANTAAYILDSTLQLAPAGVPGQLHLSGAGLARCYLNRPDLTAEKFIPDPFSGRTGARMYRTGDLARYQTNGEIQFLGRLDNQVKLRGYRIELGEIETILRDHPAVTETVVVSRESTQGHKDLVAYIATSNGTSESLIAELRAHLRGKLPEYMVPSYFHFLDKLPLTPNGKIDRRALPAPDRLHSAAAVSRSAPSNLIEEQLAQIWKDVLAIEHVGVNDNFFEIGGHSLLATRVMSRLCETFKVNMPLSYFFESPTVAGLAEVLRDESTKDEPVMPEIKRLPRG
jgi:amino acid adenylation domain-containing protein